MRAISDFRRELGISARSCRARFALRILVSMSAMGSVCTSGTFLPRLPSGATGHTRPAEHVEHLPRHLPARLGHAGDDALVGELPQADSAEAELLVDRARAAAAVAAGVRPRLEALRPVRFLDQGLACQLALSFAVLPGERHPQ